MTNKPAPLVLVKHGATRTVLLIHRWAVKIPSCIEWRLFLQGLLANMQERKFAGTEWPEFCPVIFGVPGGWLLVMRRAQPLTDDEWERFEPYTFCTPKDRIIPAEAKRDSFGTLNKKIVAVDYGN